MRLLLTMNEMLVVYELTTNPSCTIFISLFSFSECIHISRYARATLDTGTVHIYWRGRVFSL